MTLKLNTMPSGLSSPDAPEDGDGVDVTHNIGTFSDDDLRPLFDRYRGAFQLSVNRPCVEHFRLCVDAYDELLSAFRGGE